MVIVKVYCFTGYFLNISQRIHDRFEKLNFKTINNTRHTV